MPYPCVGVFVARLHFSRLRLAGWSYKVLALFSQRNLRKLSRISLGLGCRDLKDKDFLGKSDPYVVISRPNMGGGFEMILTSETKQVK